MKFSLSIDRFDTATVMKTDRSDFIAGQLETVAQKIREGRTDGPIKDANGVDVGSWKWTGFESKEDVLAYAKGWGLPLELSDIKTMNRGTEFFIDGMPVLEWFDGMLSD